MVENILAVLAPLTFASKLMGFSSFSINPTNFKIKTTNVDIFFRIWIVFVKLLLSFYLYDSSQQFPLQNSDIITKSLPIILVGSFILNFTAVIGTFLTRKKQSVLIKSLCEIDEMLREFDIRFNYQKQRRVLAFKVLIIIMIDVLLVVQIHALQIIFKRPVKSGLTSLFYYWILQGYSIYFMNFLVMTNAVKERFSSINECLTKRDINARDVQLLSAIHQATTDVIALINQVYSIFLMFFFGGIFCFFNIFLFSLVITRNYIADPHEVAMSTISNFEWNLYDVAMIFLVIRSTTGASGEGKRTTSVIYKIVNASADEKLNGRLMNFCQQVLSSSSRLEFSCGLFNYDWSLCFKLISASTMYLVILIQFESALSKRSIGQ